MEFSEASDSVPNSGDTNPKLGFQSPAYSTSADPETKPSDQTLELRKELDRKNLYLEDGENVEATTTTLVIEKVQEELKKQLNLKVEEDGEDKHSIGWNQDDDFKSGEEEEISMHYKEDFDNEKFGDEGWNDEGSNGNIRHQYPVRPEAEDCSYYMKTGTCKFGSNCKFNHRVRRKNQATKEKANEREEPTERLGQTECKYYLRTGGCKFGNSCRYNHSTAKPSVLPANTTIFPASELNFLGLPIRPGEKECPYYMRNGSCKYGANCRFNHPDPTAVGGCGPPSAFSSGGSAVQSSSQSSVASWSSPRGLDETAPFVPAMFPPTHRVPSQSPEWNGYRVPIYPPERSIHSSPAYVISPATDTNIYAHQQQMTVDEFPERPGVPECSYYMKTGDCKYKSNCRFHHPKKHMSKSLPCPLSDKGLPLRPGKNICSYYNRYGICKFGPACRFDHPIQPALTTGNGFPAQGTAFDDSISKEESRMAETGNNNAI